MPKPTPRVKPYETVKDKNPKSDRQVTYVKGGLKSKQEQRDFANKTKRSMKKNRSGPNAEGQYAADRREVTQKYKKSIKKPASGKQNPKVKHK